MFSDSIDRPRPTHCLKCFENARENIRGLSIVLFQSVDKGGKKKVQETYTTICLRPSNGLRMNLRVRRVTSDILAVLLKSDCEKIESKV